MSRRLIGAALLAAACAPVAAPLQRPVLDIRVERRAADTVRLALHAATGARINARLLPALETTHDTLRFTGRADSLGDYFVVAPTVDLPRSWLTTGGTVVAGVCDAGASVCHVVRHRLAPTP